MGLDMYLSKHTYVKRWDHQSKEEKFSVNVKKGGRVYAPIKKDRVSYIIETVMYWRKANQIHNWFIENLAGGEDNCQEIYVPFDKLVELRDTCKKVLDACELKKGVVKNGYTFKNGVKEPNLEEGDMIVGGEDVCEELLPSSSGFFFGSADYDQWYYEDVENTYKELTELVEEPDAESGDYYYLASW